MPVVSVTTFIIGFNINTRHSKKIGLKRKEKITPFQQVMANIDRYDGTDKGQEEVK